MPYLSTLKLAAIGIGIALLAAFLIHVKGRMDFANAMVAATREAVDNPDLGEGQVIQQITALGGDRAELIRLQDSIRVEAARTKDARDAARKASSEGAERGKGYASAAASLDASAARAGVDCEPSDTSKGLWR